MSGYQQASLASIRTNKKKPAERREVSPVLDIHDYNYNIATLPSGSRLSQNAYHYHESQKEFFHILSGRCRVEVEDGAFTLESDDLIIFETGTPHLLHNPYKQICRVVAIGSPPKGRYPVHQIQSYEDLLEERYNGNVPTGDGQ